MAASDYVPTFFKKPLALGRHLNCLFAERYADQPPAICVEQRIYDSFPSSDDEARLAMFHKQDWKPSFLDRGGTVPRTWIERFGSVHNHG